MLGDSFDEHVEVKRQLAALVETEPEDEAWHERLVALREDVQAHFEREELETLPAAAQLLDGDELVALAQEMVAFEATLEEENDEGAVEQVLGGIELTAVP
jgi:hypothetical protein